MRGLILDNELKTAERSQPVDRGRQRGKDYGSRDSEQFGAHTVENGRRGMSLALALGVGFERNKDEALVRCTPRKAKAGNGESSFRLGQITQHIGYLLADRLRVFE